MNILNLFVKKAILYFLIVLLMIQPKIYAAIVSDNDGQAFVSKSEFEALKTDLNSQLDRYSASIDAKVDGAIASYLAGIQLAQKLDLDSLLNSINAACDDSYMNGTNKVRFGYRCMAKSYSVPTTQKPVGAITRAFVHKGYMGASPGSSFLGGWMRLGLDYNNRGNVGDVAIPSSGRQNGKYLLMNKHTNYNNKFSLSNEWADVLYRYYVIGNQAGHDSNQFPSGSDAFTWTMPTFRNTDSTWSIKYTDITCGFATMTANNIRCFYGPTYEMSKTLSVLPICGQISGTAYGLENDKIKNMTLQESSQPWTWYAGNGTYMYRKSGSSWTQYTASLVSPDSTFNFNCHPYQQITLSDLIDYNATRIYGEGNVAIYGGLPIFKVPDNGKVTMKITFKSQSGNDVYVGLSKKQFPNDNTAYSIQGDLNLKNENGEKYTSNRFSVNNEYTFVMDVEKNDVVWIKTYDSTSNTGFTGAETSSISFVSD